MEYIDFVKRKVQLHHEIENAIKEMMMEKGVTEIDLLKDEESFDAGWLIRSIGDTNALEEVLVANIKVENNTLYYKGKTTCETDEDWQLLVVSADNACFCGSIGVVEARMRKYHSQQIKITLRHWCGPRLYKIDFVRLRRPVSFPPSAAGRVSAMRFPFP